MRGQVYAVCEGKALPFVGVEAAVRDHAAIDQAAAGQFHPRMARVVAVAADDAAALFLLIADIDLGRGFGEREIGGAQPETDVVAFALGREAGLESVFAVPNLEAAVDDEADRTSVVEGKSVVVRRDLGGGGNIKTKK